MEVELLTPEGVLYAGDASMVIARTLDGEIGLLEGHAPILGVLLPGPLRIVRPGGGEEVAAVESGFVEVRDGRVTILCDAAELTKAGQPPSHSGPGPRTLR
jgi:F-type H+-transporting ATPase subunit epsilon